MPPNEDKAVLEQVDELGQHIDKLVGKFDKTDERFVEVKQSASKDLKDLRETICSLAKPEADPEIRKAIEDLINQVVEDKHIDRVALGGESTSREFKCFDPYEFETGEKTYDFDAVDTKDLLDRGHKGFNEFLARPAINDQHRNLQRVADDVWMLDGIARAVEREKYTGFESQFPKMSRVWGRIVNKLLVSYGSKADADAMDTSDTGSWIPTAFSNQLRDIIKVQLRVAALFERVRMPTPEYKLPVNLTDVVADLVGEQTDLAGAPSSDTNTQVLDDVIATLSAKKTRGRMVISGELLEDSIVPALPLLRRTVGEALANAEERGTLDGDTTGPHQDNDVTAATDARKAFPGIRKYLLAGDGAAFSSDLGTLTAEALIALNGSMGEYGIDPMDTVYVASFSAFIRLLKLADANGNLVTTTVDKYGSAATILQGELGRVWGRPIVVSRYARQNLAATGVNTSGGPNNKTYIMALNRRGWLIGDRREVTFEMVRHAIHDQNEIVAFRRMAFTNVFGTSGAASAKKMGWYGYNVTN